MKRRINHTGRKKISRKDVVLTVIHRGNEPSTFEAILDLDSLQLPPNAPVFIEAYHRTNYMRFSYGTTALPGPESLPLLSGLEGTERIYFRVKVVDPENTGRILAEADRLSPKDAQDSDENRTSLLHFELCDLGQEVWRLNLNRQWPTLEVNNRLPDGTSLARSDLTFRALVYPSVTRQILTYIMFCRSESWDEEGDDWESLWIQWAIKTPGVGSPPSPEDAEEEKMNWVDSVVKARSRRELNLDSYLKDLGGDK